MGNINILIAIIFFTVVTEMLHTQVPDAVKCFPSHGHYIRSGITKYFKVDGVQSPCFSDTGVGEWPWRRRGR